ncbi:MAG: hypothetical protein QOI96_213 [Verrucomicrobiota bacterium]|jgi:hypothetical protein
MIWAVAVICVLLTAASIIYFLKRRQQGRFIQKTLASTGFRKEQRVIVCLSTLPDRIHNLEPTIQCLLRQTRRPDEIVIAVPRFSIRQRRSYELPDYLTRFPEVRILHCEKDWGPATKFIPIIQEELAAGRTQTLIMVVDDDRVYPRDALETYFHYHKQLPDAALCFRGGPMPTNFRWFIPKLFLGSRIQEPKRVAVITGCGSYLIQPRFFNSALWDYSDAPAAAFYMDDIWISGNLDRRGVQKYVVPTSSMMRTVPQQVGTMTLYRVPRSRRHNNHQTALYFRDTWDVLSAPFGLDYRVRQLLPSWIIPRSERRSNSSNQIP